MVREFWQAVSGQRFAEIEGNIEHCHDVLFFIEARQRIDRQLVELVEDNWISEINFDWEFTADEVLLKDKEKAELYLEQTKKYLAENKEEVFRQEIKDGFSTYFRNMLLECKNQKEAGKIPRKHLRWIVFFADRFSLFFEDGYGTAIERMELFIVWTKSEGYDYAKGRERKTEVVTTTNGKEVRFEVVKKDPKGEPATSTPKQKHTIDLLDPTPLFSTPSRRSLGYAYSLFTEIGILPEKETHEPFSSVFLFPSACIFTLTGELVKGRSDTYIVDIEIGHKVYSTGFWKAKDSFENYVKGYFQRHTKVNPILPHVHLNPDKAVNEEGVPPLYLDEVLCFEDVRENSTRRVRVIMKDKKEYLLDIHSEVFKVWIDDALKKHFLEQSDGVPLLGCWPRKIGFHYRIR